MTQEVRVMLQLTLETSIEITEAWVRETIQNALQELDGSDLQMVDIIEIREEAEIYGNE